MSVKTPIKRRKIGSQNADDTGMEMMYTVIVQRWAKSKKTGSEGYHAAIQDRFF